MKKLTLILLPGLLSDATVWAYQQKHLSHLVDVIIPDLNHAATPQKMVASVLSIAPPFFALAGHSMGGWVALEVIKKVPERVLGLALINTTAQPDTNEKRNARLTLISQAEQGDYAFLEKLVKLFLFKNDIADELKLMFERNKLAFINQEKAMLLREDCISTLETITCPTLIIHSANDANFSLDDSQFLATHIKSAILSIIPESGHMSPMECPQNVTQLLEKWLKTVQLSSA